ncbi:MAG: hypothetical protein Q4D51_02170 [Eubacteriales bacterium]|nr:hypothetical protein [Eubacteriales bacterium]
MGKIIGKISLIVEGDNISIDNLDMLIGITHSVYKRKGESASKIMDVLEHDIVQYTENIDEATVDLTIYEFCRKVSKRITEVDKEYICNMRIYIQSDYAQIYWKLRKETIGALHSCNVDCEFSILSWGECN